MTAPEKAEAPAPKAKGKRPQADWEKVKKQFPSTQFGEKEWGAIFDADPDIAYRIIGDICKAYIATESEVRRTGRRPTPSLSLAEVERILSPNYSMEPFADALASLMVGRSQRAFAARVPVHHHTLRRLLDGTTPPSMAMMASLAKAGRVQPHYFMEYRAAAIAQAMTEHLHKHPNQSIRFYKEIRRRVDAP